MDRKLRLERFEGGGGTLIRMAGVIDADLAGADVVNSVGNAVVFDLEGVDRVTSFGVREWTRLLSRVQTGWIGFIHCHPIVVAQFNSVADFGRQGQVVSLYVPYVCESCGHECEELLDLRDRFDVVDASEAPKIKCPACGEAADLDDIPENYFSFVRAQGRPRVPDNASRLIAGKLDAAPFHIDKEVDGEVTALWLSGSLDARTRLKRVLDGVEGAAVIEMGGLASVEAEGAAKLRATLRSDELKPYLARVGVGRLAPLYRGHLDEIPHSLVSIVADASCPSCHAGVRVEIPASQASTSPRSFICDRCYAEGAVSLAADVVELVQEARCLEVPREVAQYLEAHPLGYRPSDRSKSGSGSATAPPHSSAYEIIRRIGRGGMAEVFLARKKGIEGFEKNVVLKRMLAQLSRNEEFARMFLQEARVAARINHPNVVQIYDLGLEDGQYFIAMEYVKGWDLAILAKAVRRSGQRVPIGIACRIVADACAGLHAAHVCKDERGELQGVVHRDVSPHNILVSTEGVVKITDFGISKVDESAVHTQTGLVKGKVPYMAPEQLEASIGVADHRVDVYQAGVVLAELLIGFSPFHLESDLKTLNAVVRGDLPDLRKARPELSDRIDKIARKALALRPDARHRTARDLQMDLEAAIIEVEGKPLTSTAVSSWIAELAASALKQGHLPSALTPAGRDDDEDGSATELVGGGRKT